MELEIILQENNRDRTRQTLGSGEYVIGRDEACEVVIASEAVSRRHARLTVNETHVFVEDLGSANGTYIDGHRAEGRVLLAPGQKVLLGRVQMQAVWRSETTADPRAPADKPSPHSAEEFLEDYKYDLGDVVGSGGMGVIRRARDRHVRRSVAMKLMSPAAVETPAKRLRFVEEAQVTGQLEHPNIVPVYDLGIDANGQPYYTMKFVRGIDLKVVLDDIREGQADTIAQFPLGRLLTIFQKACDAISFAHSKGVIHRDLKPENIMIGDFGEVLVMDWGLAKTLGKTSEYETAESSIESERMLSNAFQTVDGSVLGTPHFMSPEQAAGKIDQLDVRTDIFALGGVLYNILTLEPPFPGDTAQESLHKIHTGTITPPLEFNRPTPERPSLIHCPDRRIPESLAAVAMKALAINPGDRYQTVRELQKDIEAHQGGFATIAERAGTFKQLVLLVRRRKVEFSLVAIAIVALLTVGSVALARIIASERFARESLEALHNAAPAYASQAESLIDEQKFSMALGKIGTAIELMPTRADFYDVKGNILESLLRLPEAREEYSQALKINPRDPVAQPNLVLCDKLLNDAPNPEKLPPAALNELQAAMLSQRRSAEALAMVRQLDTKNQSLYDTWKTILEREGLLVKAKNTTRLIVNDAGEFFLDLSNTKTDNIAALREMPLRELSLTGTDVRDLTPLANAPLVSLNLRDTPVSDLEPLRGMPLKRIVLSGCKNLTDLEPLCDCKELELIVLPPEPVNVECLRKLPHLARMTRPGRLGPRPAPDETLSAADYWKDYDARHSAPK